MIRNWKNTRPARGHRPGVAVARRSPPPGIAASSGHAAWSDRRRGAGGPRGAGRGRVAGWSRARSGRERPMGAAGLSGGPAFLSASVSPAQPCSVRLRPAQSSSDQPWADRAFGASGPRVTEQVRRLPDARGGRAPRPPAPPLSPSGGFSLLGAVDCKRGGRWQGEGIAGAFARFAGHPCHPRCVTEEKSGPGAIMRKQAPASSQTWKPRHFPCADAELQRPNRRMMEHSSTTAESRLRRRDSVKR